MFWRDGHFMKLVLPCLVEICSEVVDLSNRKGKQIYVTIIPFCSSLSMHVRETSAAYEQRGVQRVLLILSCIGNQCGRRR